MRRRLRKTVEYIYWSSRRTARFVEDNNLAAADRQVTRTISSPTLPWLPTLSSAATSTGGLRAQTARAIERALGPIAVSRFDQPGPIKYAKGISPVVFGEFRVPHLHDERQPAVMFTAANYGRSDPNTVAVCLYGSMENFLEYLQDSGPGFRDGWVSSSAPAIYEFIKAHGRLDSESYLDAHEVAIEALKIADGQGIAALFNSPTDEDGLGLDRPWQRAYTYGELPKAHWLAQIYLDVDLSADRQGSEDGFRRILVGAPLWIRASDAGAVQLYSQSQKQQIVEARRIVAARGMVRAEFTPQPSADRSEELPTVTTVHFENEPQVAPSPVHGVNVPYNIYGIIRSGFVESQANIVIKDILEIPYGKREAHPGPLFGRVLAWVWDDDKDSAISLLADYLADLRDPWRPEKIEPPISLDEVLHGLRLALPTRFGDYDELVTWARRDLRRYNGA